MTTRVLMLVTLTATLAWSCGPSKAEQEAEQKFREVVEEAASQPARYGPADGQPATRPLVPAGFATGRFDQPASAPPAEAPAATPAKPE